jgi:(S)-2-hydroxyglutarate dehydrogenase
MNENKYDYLIVGAGIIGLTIAKEIKKRFPLSKIGILEKESKEAQHSSGRNSGVLHAGFYYTADSLKAKFTRDGNFLMKEFCKENKLKINHSQKVVVAKNNEEVKTIHKLYERGIQNKVNVEIISKKRLKELDPNIKTHNIALFSPDTSTIDPEEVCAFLKNFLIEKGVDFYFNEGYKENLNNNSILSSKNKIFKFEKLINTAGLYADKIAKDFAFSKDYTIIPFKGIYLKYTGIKKPVNINVYPVPNLNNPFLGVHFTITVNGEVIIGPTSIPAFWRENYSGMDNFNLSELINVLGWEVNLFLNNEFNFRTLAFQEIKKYNKNHFTNLASSMLYNFDKKSFSEWIRPGIRAQLLNKKTKELVMDFVVEGDANTIHILNAVSPAFTCSIPFAKYVVDNYII